MSPRPEDPGDGLPARVLLVPPPVRPRRIPLGIPPIPKAAKSPVERWVEDDALSATGTPPPSRLLPVRPPPPRTPSPPARFAELLLEDPTDERSTASGPAPLDVIDDPLTISSSDTVPLFGLAPPREASPPSVAREAQPNLPTWVWVGAGIAILLSLGGALGLLLT